MVLFLKRDENLIATPDDLFVFKFSFTYYYTYRFGHYKLFYTTDSACLTEHTTDENAVVWHPFTVVSAHSSDAGTTLTVDADQNGVTASLVASSTDTQTYTTEARINQTLPGKITAIRLDPKHGAPSNFVINEIQLYSTVKPVENNEKIFGESVSFDDIMESVDVSMQNATGTSTQGNYPPAKALVPSTLYYDGYVKNCLFF